jgi:gliding motility-associated lipoprotein GldH
MSSETGVLFTFVKTHYLKALQSFLIIVCLLGCISCTRTNLFEKTAVIPGHSWKSNFKPSFTFSITDTTAPYMIYLIIRHNDRYSFNNIYVNLYAKGPGSDTAQVVPYDMRLGTDETGWLGSGMDDIYEHREPITPRSPDKAFYFRKPGEYTFTLEQIMRQDPLENVLNAGIRIEKK